MAADGIFAPAAWTQRAQRPIRVKWEYCESYAFHTPDPIETLNVSALQRFVAEIRNMMARRR